MGGVLRQDEAVDLGGSGRGAISGRVSCHSKGLRRRFRARPNGGRGAAGL